MPDNHENNLNDNDSEELLKSLEVRPEAEGESKPAVDPMSGDVSENKTVDSSDSAPAETTENHRVHIDVSDGEKTHWYKQKKWLGLTAVLIALVGAGYTLFLKPEPVALVEIQTPETNVAVEMKRFGVAVGLVEGTVEYAADNNKWSTVDADVSLKEGDSIRTSGSSRVVLLIDDGSAVRLSENSEVKLTSLKIDDVVVSNIAGEVYNRVVTSDSRAYAVSVDDESYVAKGTAYRTFNTSTKKGVEVFQSTVEVGTKTTDVVEGNAYFTNSDVKEKEGVVSAIDLEALKSDEFIKWNAEQDKKSTEFAEKLGVLSDIDKPSKVVEKPKPAASGTSGITLKGSQSGSSAVFSWSSTGVDTSEGFKLVRSSSNKTPTYPDNSIVYIEKGKSSYTFTDKDGGTYYYRLCAYRGDSCDSYSNMVTVTTDKKVKEVVEAGAVTLGITGNIASWTYAGTAPYGFKVVLGTSPNPTYEDGYKKLYSDSGNATLPSEGLTSGTTYYVRVCKYTDGGCQDYSNEVNYLAP